MASVTAIAIRKAKEAEQRAILVELTSMAQEYLLQVIRGPAAERHKYLDDLRALIQERLNVGGVSIFYRTRFANSLACLLTTGVVGKDGKVTTDEVTIPIVPNKGLIGKCFNANEMVVERNRRQNLGQDEPYPEYSTSEQKQDPDPIALVPIRSPLNRAVGVIRCVDHYNRTFPDRRVNFDPLERETLGFIASHVGMILHMFEQRIDRESTIAAVKHDLLAPVLQIQNLAREVLETAKPSLTDADLRDIAFCSELAMNLVDQLDPEQRSITADHDRTPTCFATDVANPVSNIMRQYAESDNRMTLVFENVDSTPLMTIDRQQIRRTLFHLITNAVKYGQRGSQITVRTRRTAGAVEIQVENDGHGVSRNSEELIFKAYYRDPEAMKLSKSGVGLGLSIVRDIMKAHGGSITLTSARQPTLFTLSFPNQLVIQKE